MELPKFSDTFLPILQVLSNGNEIHNRELALCVKENYYNDLPEEFLALKTSSGANVLFDRIGWGKSYLKQGKFVEYPKRGYVRITKKGLKVASLDKFTLQDLKNDSDFLAHRLLKQKAIIEVKDDTQTDTPQDMIDIGFNAISESVKNELLDKLKEVDPYYFENIILKLLQAMGYGDFLETKKSNDGGIDGIINEDKLGLDKIYIQAKRYETAKVREKDIRNFIGAMSGDTTKGVFVTTSDFDDKAIKKAKNAHHKIILINGHRLVDLMYEYEIGIQVKTVYKIKEVDNDFFEE